MSSGKVKAGQLWGKNKDDLTKHLGDVVTLTVINSKQRARFVARSPAFLASSLLYPLDLRTRISR